MTPARQLPVVLIVNHDASARRDLRRVLEEGQFRVLEVNSGSEALEVARSDKPDLVLLEVNLPDVNGVEVCRRIKASPETSRIPVLHISASFLSPEEMARGLEAGADSYLVEPVDPAVLVATLRAVLRARRAEESAHELAREWQSTFNAISDGVAILDAGGRVRRFNGRMSRMLGRDVQELVGSPGASLLAGLPDEKQPLSLALLTGERQSIEIEYDSRSLVVTVDPVFDEEGRLTGAVQIMRDVTERRQLEEQFRDSQKFETIGTLAAGVAHDFNNLLTSIMGNASLMASDMAADSPQREQLEDIVKASQRAADLTGQLLAYSGKGRHYMQKVELSSLVDEVRHLIEAAIPKKIALHMRLGRGLPRIDADPNQIQQVVMNLVSNAAEAIGEDKGSISISTGRDADETVFLEVADTGCGMDAETKARIFDPFFTTKFTGRGLGLAAVAGISRGHKALLRVNTAPGEGSTFRISFPAAEEPAAAKSPAGADLSGACTVLVVDDEDMVRRIARAALEIRGYEVVIATNGMDAIRAARQNPAVRLVLLDLTMPVMGGEEAIDGILEACPQARVIVSTGYDHREMVSRFNRKQVAGYLQKPYTSRQLAEKVKQILSEAQP
jgi:PAS domain S-box-containing protein